MLALGAESGVDVDRRIARGRHQESAKLLRYVRRRTRGIFLRNSRSGIEDEHDVDITAESEFASSEATHADHGEPQQALISAWDRCPRDSERTFESGLSDIRQRRSARIDVSHAHKTRYGKSQEFTASKGANRGDRGFGFVMSLGDGGRLDEKHGK